MILLDGTMITYDTRKVRPLSDIAHESASSPEAYVKDLGHDTSNVRPGRRSRHHLYTYLREHPALQNILGINLLYLDNGKFVVRDEWLENPPSVVEEGMSTDDM